MSKLAVGVFSACFRHAFFRQCRAPVATTTPVFACVSHAHNILRHMSSSTAIEPAQHGPSPTAKKMMQFFPVGTGFEDVQAGRSWLPRELRVKSNEELHKLWYVLLKERNKLKTVRYESRKQGLRMPAADRERKVQRSMAAIKIVLGERQRAQRKASRNLWVKARTITDLPLTSVDKIKERRLLLSGNEGQQTSGVIRPGRVRPGQRQRPMRHLEKTRFRVGIAMMRFQQDARANAELMAELQTAPDEVVEEMFTEVAIQMLRGYFPGILPYRLQIILAEARRRGMTEL